MKLFSLISTILLFSTLSFAKPDPNEQIGKEKTTSSYSIASKFAMTVNGALPQNLLYSSLETKKSKNEIFSQKSKEARQNNSGRSSRGSNTEN